MFARTTSRFALLEDGSEDPVGLIIHRRTHSNMKSVVSSRVTKGRQCRKQSWGLWLWTGFDAADIPSKSVFDADHGRQRPNWTRITTATSWKLFRLYGNAPLRARRAHHKSLAQPTRKACSTREGRSDEEDELGKSAADAPSRDDLVRRLSASSPPQLRNTAAQINKTFG
jgi:hypothetical protein